MTFISGWAHDAESMEPLAESFRPEFDVTVLSGADVLRAKHLPEAEAVVGWSMGGLVAIEHLRASCKKLVLLSSTARFCATESYPCGVAEKNLQRMILQLKRNPNAVLASFYKNVHHPRPAPRTEPDCEENELADGLEYLLRTDLREKVSSIKIPILLIHGKKDLIIPPSASEWLHGHLPDTQLALLENAGHALDSAVTAPLINRFLTRKNHD